MEKIKPLKIFLVDDDLYCLNLFGRYLNYLGHTHIQYFTKSSECLDQLPLKPDLVFLDYQMDNLGGIQLLRKIKRFDPNIQVVYISGQEEIDVAVNAMKYGALDCITKTRMDEQKMRRCLGKVLQIRDGLQEKGRRGRVTRIFSEIEALSALFFLQGWFSRV